LAVKRRCCPNSIVRPSRRRPERTPCESGPFLVTPPQARCPPMRCVQGRGLVRLRPSGVRQTSATAQERDDRVKSTSLDCPPLLRVFQVLCHAGWCSRLSDLPQGSNRASQFCRCNSVDKESQTRYAGHRSCSATRTEDALMHTVVRSFSGKGAKELFDLLEKNKADVEKTLRSVKGLVSYTLVRSTDGGFS